MRTSTTFSLPSIIVLGAVTLLCACHRQAKETKKTAVPVVVGAVVRKDVPVIVRAIGRVTSSATVSVKPQVTGTIFEVHFTDGQSVKKGDMLVTIDKRPFEVALEQARAALAESQTKSDNAREHAERYLTLGKAGSASKEQISEFTATAKAAQSAVQITAAAVKSAELQLDYCSVRAPIDGRAGKALVTAGNVVTANQSDLVVVNRIAPAEVTFSVAEQQLTAVQQGMATGKPKVTARTSGTDRQQAQGELTFVDNNVKAVTGTIELKATFRNEPQVLWPGQFVTIRLEVGITRDAVVAPAAAVQDGQNGPYVFVIKPDKTADIRKVVIDRTANDEAVIKSGLDGGEQIVIDGQSRLTVGSSVEIVTAAPTPGPSPTESPAPKMP
jgi:multidrug efflux system membrane fusion protein